VARSDIDAILGRATFLAHEINKFVPNDPKAIEFRADLAGLLVVAMAASYESCVKETLITFASRHHDQFGIFAQSHFRKLNSRISLQDLYGYAKTFDKTVHKKFTQLIESRKSKLVTRIGRDFTTAYSQILSWRHDFAHAGLRNTTVEEALATHCLAKRVLYSFDDAFK
jgi:hypothetical protein